jgi:hypothetical protein
MLEILTNNYPEKMIWTLYKNGLFKLEASPLRKRLSDIDFIGISFNYPEENARQSDGWARDHTGLGRTG